MKIAVYGLGKMGLPLALVLATNGFQVVGADIDKNKNEMLNNGKDPLGTEPGVQELLTKALEQKTFSAIDNLEQAAKESEMHIILVPTLIKNGKADLTVVHSVCEQIAKGLKKGDVVITECTMPPGETDNLVPILEKSGLKKEEFGVAHCPERTMSGTAIRDITGEYPKIVGASDNSSLEKVVSVYEKINKKGVVKMPCVKEAEAVKVFEGIFRDVNIALANELAFYCKENELDAIRIYNACNSQPMTLLHMPGYVGGHCIPYYPQFIASGKTPLINTARKTNESVLDWVVENLKKNLSKKGRELKNSKVILLGLTFRGGVKEFEHSAALGLIPLLRQEGVKDVYALDPLCSEEDGDRFGVLMQKDLKGMDAVVILANHNQFKTIDWEKTAQEMRNRVVIDIRNIVDPSLLKENDFLVTVLGKV